MKLLVVVDTLNGSFIIRSIASTFTTPEPMPSSADSTPATNISPKPAGTPSTEYACIPRGVGYDELNRNRDAHGCGASVVVCSSCGWNERHAEYNNTTPNSTANALVGMKPLIAAPMSAPIVVATSRKMP